MDANNQIRNGANRYGVMLAENINKALPKAKCFYGNGNIFIYLPDSLGYKASGKGWLYTLLEGLPEIDAPLQRLQAVIYVNEAIECVTIINPSEFDVTALDHAQESGLKFSQPPFYLEPLPLDHSWYSDKDYFKKQNKKKKGKVTFDDVKDLPNVKPILDDMRKDGIDI